MISAIKSRLEAEIPTLANRIQGAVAFAELMQTKNLPQQTPAAYVVPLGLQGGAVAASSGAFTQMLAETIGVILIVRTHDLTGDKELTSIEGLIKQAINAIAGWSTNDEVGVFQVSRGQLVNMSAGTIVYQLDFSISDQLRITS
jgi:hypothetical protein